MMEITLTRGAFLYPNKVQARLEAVEQTQWLGNLQIDVFVDPDDSVDAMKAAAIAAAKDLLTRVVSEMNMTTVRTGPSPVS